MRSLPGERTWSTSGMRASHPSTDRATRRDTTVSSPSRTRPRIAAATAILRAMRKGGGHCNDRSLAKILWLQYATFYGSTYVMPAENSNWRKALCRDLDADAQRSSFVEGAHNNQKDREQSIRLIYWTPTQLE